MSENKFVGVIQGLSHKKIEKILEFNNQKDFVIKRVSPLKTKMKIGLKGSTGVDEIRFKGEPDSLRDDINFTVIGLDRYNLPQSSLFLTIVFFILLGILFLWALIIIPVLLLLFSLLSKGYVWKMLNIYLIEMKPPSESRFERIVVNIYMMGGITSDLWLLGIRNGSDRKELNVIRKTHIWFMRGLCVTSYCFFILALIITASIFVSITGTVMEVLWMTLLSLGGASILISIYMLIRLKKLNRILNSTISQKMKSTKNRN